MTTSHTNLTYTVSTGERGQPVIDGEAVLRGRPLPPTLLTRMLATMPDHYEAHEALAMLHAMTADPDLAGAICATLTEYRRDHYLRLYAHALPDGWELRETPHVHEARILAPPGPAPTNPEGDRYEYASIPTHDIDEMRRALDEATTAISDEVRHRQHDDRRGQQETAADDEAEDREHEGHDGEDVVSVHAPEGTDRYGR